MFSGSKIAVLIAVVGLFIWALGWAKRLKSVRDAVNRKGPRLRDESRAEAAAHHAAAARQAGPPVDLHRCPRCNAWVDRVGHKCPPPQA